MKSPEEREAARQREDEQRRKRHAVQADIETAEAALEAMFTDLTLDGKHSEEIAAILYPSYRRAKSALQRIAQAAGAP